MAAKDTSLIECRDERGQTLVEWALAIALTTIVLVVIFVVVKA